MPRNVAEQDFTVLPITIMML